MFRGIRTGFRILFRGPPRRRRGFSPGGDSVLAHSYDIIHYYHSGFSVSCGDTLLVFDYWRGEEGELTEDLQLSPGRIRSFPHVVVFISHEHIDHLDPVVFSWEGLTDVTYIISSDMPAGTPGRRMAPGDTFSPVRGVDITAFDSTDLGVSFLVDFRGIRFFHAGDLNFWHWREESTMQDIEEADAEFRRAVAPLVSQAVDVAFFPVDPRQGSMFEAGANYFILSVKPRVLIPMHYFHRSDAAMEYARTASCRSTEVIAMPSLGETLTLEAGDDGYFNIRFQASPRMEDSGEDPEEAGGGFPPKTDPDDGLFPAENVLSGEDPFAESDLPISSLSEEDEEGV